MAAARKPFTVEDLWTIPRPGAPSLAPDGSRFVLALTRYDMEKNEGHDELWLHRLSGGRRRLARAASGADPRWSPDGRQIAFIDKREGDEVPQIYLIDPDGGEARRLTRLATGASNLVWFPDSRRLAFISWAWPDLATPQAQARRMREQEKDAVRAHASERVSYRYWDHWLSDGRVPRVFTVNVGNGACRDLLAGSSLSLVWFDPTRECFDLSPDGRYLVLSADLSSEPKWGNDLDLILFELATGKRRNLTAGSGFSHTEPRFSPDGKSLAYLRCDYHRSLDDQAVIVLRELRSGTTRELAPAWDRAPSHLRWSPDGGAVFCLAEDRARQALFRVPLDGGAAVAITGEGTVTSFDLAPDGHHLVYNQSSLSEAPAVFARPQKGGEAKLVTAPGARILAGNLLGEVREFNISGAGGEPVQMWVTYPPRFDPEKRWPLLQMIHGGPHAAWLDFFHFRWNAQIFAAQGYVVAAVNYHGSSGWGQAFLESDNGCYGEKEMADVEAATAFLLQQGYIDRERLFAAGGSYGGYMVALLNGHEAPYQAYVCHAGCWDWMSMMATDVYSYFNHELGAFHWEDEAQVMKQSPHHYAGTCKTPTLVIHGELDYRVPAAQGLQYYATLKARGVPARLLVFPDENHWILKPKNARRWTAEFLDWLARFGGPRLRRPKGARAARTAALPKRVR